MASFVFGYATDRTIRRNVILVGLVVWSIATAASGLATGFGSLFAARFFTGAGEASLYPAAMSLIAERFPVAGRGRAMGIFGAAAAVGAGLAVNVDVATNHAKVGTLGAGLAVAIPVAIYLMSLWVLHQRPEYQRSRLLGPIAAALVLLAPFTKHAVPVIGVLLVGVLVVKEVVRR
jgi:MFS family permease